MRPKKKRGAPARGKPRASVRAKAQPSAGKKPRPPARAKSASAARPKSRTAGRPARRAQTSYPPEYSLLMTATLCLLAFGIVMVFSASSATSLLGSSGDSFYYLKRTLIAAVIGLVLLRLLSIQGMRLVRPLTPILLVVSFALLLIVLIPGVGIGAKGAQRWIGAGPVQFQPSELTKVALVLYGAQLLSARPGLTQNLGLLMKPLLLVTGASCLLVVVEPDLGTAIVIAFSVAALLVAAGVPMRQLAMLGGALAFFAFMAILIEPYRRERLLGFLDPSADASGAGFQGIQATIAMGSGGLFGVGIGESVQKAFYLPEAHTDMILAVIGEEWGLVGVAGLVALYTIIGYAGFRTAKNARDRHSQLVAAGLTSMILCQACLNFFAVMGLAPLTGVPLPFVSYGNSSLMMMLGSVGLLLNIAKTGGAARLQVLEGGGRRASQVDQGRHSGGRNSRARSAGAGSRRRAAG